MSQRVIEVLRELGPTEDAAVFTTLLYFGRNSRSALDSWKNNCSKREGDLCQAVWDVLGDEYPTDTRKFPVSAATGYAGGLDKGIQKAGVKYKCCLLTVLQAHNIMAAQQRDPSILEDYRAVQAVTKSSKLQALMISRTWCHAFGLTRKHVDEEWTEASLPPVPARWRQCTPGQFGRNLRICAQTYPVVSYVALLSFDLGIQFFSGSHVEHQGCEIRKFDSAACV